MALSEQSLLRSNATLETVTPFDRVRPGAKLRALARSKVGLPILLGVITLISRCLTVSTPYFVDGPNHVRAIENGSLVIQAPGYFLFEALGAALSALLHISAAASLRMLNIGFGVGAVVVFSLLALRIFEVRLAAMLALVYAASPLVWFAAEIHSTYAAMTFFAPLLLLVIGEKKQFTLGCLLWAIMVGLRPSDGIFVLPWLLWQGYEQRWRARLQGLVVGVAGVLTWWLPTAQRFGGSILSPLTASRSQASRLAQGVLVAPLSMHSATNLLRGVSGMVVAWGLLLPLVLWGGWRLWRQERRVRAGVVWMVPGLAYFLFYYMADATYFAFCVAPGLLLAGLVLCRMPRSRQGMVTGAALLGSLVLLLAGRPVAPTHRSEAVLDAYFMKYTAWSLRHHYAPTLSDLVSEPDPKTGAGRAAPR